MLIISPKHDPVLNSSLRKFCYTVRERTMIKHINELTDMPNWQRQIFDNDFTFNWKNALVMSARDVTRSMADWVSRHVICQCKTTKSSSVWRKSSNIRLKIPYPQ